MRLPRMSLLAATKGMPNDFGNVGISILRGGLPLAGSGMIG